MASKTELEERIKKLRDENKTLRKDLDSSVRSVETLQFEKEQLESALDLLDVAAEVDVNFEELGDYVVLDGLRYQIERVRTGADMFEDIKKRLVSEGQTCITIKREGA